MKIQMLIGVAFAFACGGYLGARYAEDACQQPARKSMLTTQSMRLVRYGGGRHQCVAFCPTPQERAGERQQKAWDSQGSHGGTRDQDSARYMQRYKS